MAVQKWVSNFCEIQQWESVFQLSTTQQFTWKCISALQFGVFIFPDSETKVSSFLPSVTYQVYLIHSSLIHSKNCDISCICIWSQVKEEETLTRQIGKLKKLIQTGERVAGTRRRSLSAIDLSSSSRTVCDREKELFPKRKRKDGGGGAKSTRHSLFLSLYLVAQWKRVRNNGVEKKKKKLNKNKRKMGTSTMKSRNRLI